MSSQFVDKATNKIYIKRTHRRV